MTQEGRDRLRGALGRVERALGQHGAGPPPVPSAPPASADGAPATMHKGAIVAVTLLVAGEDAPAHDFAATASAAARAVVAAGIAAHATPLTVTVQGVAVDDDSPDRDV
jgi:hypothetical protein